MGKEISGLDCEEFYADANLFIYAVLDDGDVGEKARAVLKDVEEGKFRAFSSVLTLDEVLWSVQKVLGRARAAEAARVLLSLPNLHFLEVDEKMLGDVVESYVSGSLDPRDAIHLVCMRAKKLDVIVSGDSDFDKVGEIRRFDFRK